MFLIERLVDYSQSFWQSTIRFLLSRKKAVPVAFRIDSLATWDKRSPVFWEMIRDPRFAPVVAVTRGKWSASKTGASEEANRIIATLQDEGIQAVDSASLGPRDLLGTLGLVIDDDPWEFNKPKKWLPSRYGSILWVIIPYTMGTTSASDGHALSRPYRRAWRVFYPTQQWLDLSMALSSRCRINGRYDGYPCISQFATSGDGRSISGQSQPNCDSRPLLVWAPHWTIDEGDGNQGDFLEWHELLLHLAKADRSDVRWAFRPHPLLRSRVENLWGSRAAETYFKEWATLSGSRQHYSYARLFVESSGLLHDSASFLGEYLFTGKPVAVTEREDGGLMSGLNSVGKECLDVHYRVKGEDDLREFIQVVTGTRPDEMRDRRAAVAAALGGDQPDAAQRIVSRIAVDLRGRNANPPAGSDPAAPLRRWGRSRSHA